MRLGLAFSLGFLALCLLVSPSGQARAQDVASGQRYFQQNCLSCHSTSQDRANKAGPGLFGLMGRKVGANPGYAYSEALERAQKSGKIWNETRLNAYLTNPSGTFPGTAMPVNIPNAKDRLNVVAYLKTLTKGAKPKSAPKAPATPVRATPPSNLGPDHWKDDYPGKLHTIRLEALPPPYADPSASNGPRLVSRPSDALPQVPEGFAISLFASDPDKGRYMLFEPSGDILISVPSKGLIKRLKVNADGKTGTVTPLRSGLSMPYGMAFYPNAENPTHLYIAEVNSVIRIPYARTNTALDGQVEIIVPNLTKAPGGHTTRTLVFSEDAKQMFVSVGSATNIAETMEAAPPLAEWEAQHGLGATWGDEFHRAAVLVFDPLGQSGRVYASGLRNCVGLLVHPMTHELMCSVNERDGLGDNLPPDYVTRVVDHGYYGWPWYYIGDHEDPRLSGQRPDLKGKAIVPDTLFQAHSAPLGMAVYRAPAGVSAAFGPDYEGDVFVALHGSWNRAARTGSKLVRIRVKDGKPSPSYEDFMTNMVVSDKEVWARPASVIVLKDGALLVDDDANGTFWRIAPKGK